MFFLLVIGNLAQYWRSNRFSAWGVRIWGQKYQKVASSRATRALNEHFMHNKVKFWKSEFFNSDFRFRLLAKKYNSKVFFFFSYSDQNIVKFDVKVKKHKQMNNLLIFMVWRQILLCFDQNMKKRRTLCYCTFLQAI